MITNNINKLISSIKSLDNFVICTGAGISISAGFPSTLQLLEKLTKEFEPNNYKELQNMLKHDWREVEYILDRLIDIHGERKIINSIREIYSNLEFKQSDILDSIARFPAKIYITKNFDDSLENRLNYFNKNYEVYIDGGNADMLFNDSIPVIKLNGSLSHPSSFISLANYGRRNRHRLNTDLHKSQLSSILHSGVVLFVGISFEGIEEFYDLYPSNFYPNWFFINVNKSNKLEEDIWLKRGLKTLNFKSYSDIPEFLNKLTDTINSKPKKVSYRKNNKILISTPRHKNELVFRLEDILLSLGYEVIVFSEFASAGMTLYEKFDKVIDEVGAAIILTPDMKGYKYKERFFYEMGYISAKLGRDNVIHMISRFSNFNPFDLGGQIFLEIDELEFDTRRITELLKERLRTSPNIR